MKDLNEMELREVDGGNIFLAIAEAVYDVITGDGLIGHIATYTSYYRSQMPANWTGHGY
jgi:hypothetical protein